jgi:hypothetical protein
VLQVVATPTDAVGRDLAARLLALNVVFLAETLVTREEHFLVAKFILIKALKKPSERLVFAKFCRTLIQALSPALPLHSVFE